MMLRIGWKSLLKKENRLTKLTFMDKNEIEEDDIEDDKASLASSQDDESTGVDDEEDLVSVDDDIIAGVHDQSESDVEDGSQMEELDMEQDNMMKVPPVQVTRSGRVVKKPQVYTPTFGGKRY